MKKITLDTLNNFIEFFKQQTLNQLPGKKFYAVMLFENETTLGISNNCNKWINTGNKYFTNGGMALDYYANTPCPASQLIDANSHQELLNKMNEMIRNYNNKNWLTKNLYPAL